MATLSPEVLAQLRQMTQSGGQAEYYDPATGRAYMPTYGAGRYEGENYIPGEVTGYRAYDWKPGMYSDNFELNGKQYDQLDARGNQTGTGTWEGLKKNSAMDTLLPLAMVAAPFALSMFPGLAAGAASGTVAGDAFMPGALGAGGSEVAFGSVIPGLESYVLPAAAAGGAAGGAAGASGGGSGAFLGEGVASGVPAWDGAAKAAGLSLSGAGTGLGLLDGASKWLGPAATALGALAGAKGQDASQTSVKSMDPRMDALFYGDLAPRIQGLLAKQMAPGAMQGFSDMQNVGRGLLAAPVAGNGFNRFFPGR